MPGRTKEITGLSLFWFLPRRPSTSNESKRTEKNQTTRDCPALLNSLCAGTFSVVDDQQKRGPLSADSMTASMSYDDDDNWDDNLSDDDDDDDVDDSCSLAGVDFISDR